jgi:SAM-dependent methyltransferase
MKQMLKSIWLKQSFQPSLIGILINPFYFIRRGLYKYIRLTAPRLQGKLMDFGCGRKPYENLFSVNEYIGVDIEKSGHDHALSKVDVYYDGKTIPFPDETFDSIFCSEVLEHVFNLDELLAELNRVLKKGGQMLITVPFCWNEHELPYDFGRYTSFGIKHSLQQRGFEVVEFYKSGNFARVIVQLCTLYIYSLFNTKSRIFNYLGSMLFIVPIHIVALVLLVLLPRNSSLYFNNVVLVRKRGD